MTIEKTVQSYNAQQIIFMLFEKSGVSPSGNEYTISEVDVQPLDNHKFAISFTRSWTNGIIEEVSTHLEWDEKFSFHEGTVTKDFFEPNDVIEDDLGYLDRNEY